MIHPNEINGETERALHKFPQWPTDPHHALNIIGEEFGELTRAVLMATYEPSELEDAQVEIRKEAIQLAVVALRFAASLETYQYLPAKQETQLCAYSVTTREMITDATVAIREAIKTQQGAPNAQESLFQEPQKGKDQDYAKKKALSDCIRRVFKHWVQVMDKSSAKLSDDRVRLIHRALTKFGYFEEQLIAAINGCAKTPYNMGIRDDGKPSRVYNDIELILRDAAHIERFMETANQTNEMETQSYVNFSEYTGAQEEN